MNRTCSRSRGMTLLELMIASAITSLLLVTAVSSMNREARALEEGATVVSRERRMSEVLERIGTTIQFAQGTSPRAFLTTDLGPDAASIELDTVLGFPPQGTLLLEPGTGNEERINYTSLNGTSQRILGLERGAQCSSPGGHLEGRVVHWAGMARAIEDQVGPSAELYDGQSDSDTGIVFYRGDGTGFSYRVPTDPAGGNDFFDATGIRWGAEVAGVPSLDGWSAIQFVPIDSVSEADRGQDLNRDGDTSDIFDLGRLELLSWNAVAAAPNESRVRLCRPSILQERCNWGGDLDSDGLDDPIFLWVPAEGRLELQLNYLAGTLNGRDIVRRAATTLYLRNGASD